MTTETITTGVARSVVAVTLFLAGCGGNSSDTPAESSESIVSQTNDVPDEVSSEVRTGEFIDSAVSGIGYETPTQVGTTDRSGRFRFRDGEQITFYLGDASLPNTSVLTLGETVAAATLTPLDLSESGLMDQRVVNTVRLLQTLDADLDPANGIEVSSEGYDKLEEIPLIDLSVEPERFATDPMVLDYIDRHAGRFSLVDVKTALDHFNRSLNEMMGALSGSWTLVDAQFEGVVSTDLQITFDFTSEGSIRADYWWQGDKASVSADLSSEGLSLGIEADSTQVTLNELPPILNPLSQSLGSEGGSNGDTDSALVQLISQTLLDNSVEYRHWPNHLQLTSAQESILLVFAPSDPEGGEVAAWLEIFPENVVLDGIGESVRLEATALGANSAPVPAVEFSWQSDSPNVASVNSDGVVTAISEGGAQVSAQAGGLMVSAQVSVSVEESPGAQAGSHDDEEIDDDPDQAGDCVQATESVSENITEVEQITQSGGEDDVEQDNVQTIEQTGPDGGC